LHEEVEQADDEVDILNQDNATEISYDVRTRGGNIMFSLWKGILKLALPSIATFSSMTLTGMITLVMVGRLGPNAIAIVGISNIFMYNVWSLFAGINEAVNYLVSQNYGEQTMNEGNSRTQLALLISAGLSILLFIASFAIPSEVFILLGANHTLVVGGAPYLHMRLISFTFSLITNVFYAYMRGVGDTKSPMYISIVSSVVLVFCTYGLTYGHFGMPNLGLPGAGISMIVSEGIGFALSAWVYYGKYNLTYQTRRWYRVRMAELRLIVKEAIKLSAMELSMSFGMLVFTWCITPLGTLALAANEITLNILSFGFMPANGFGAAATIGVGQGIGADNPIAGKRFGLHTAWLGLLFMGVFSVFLLVFAKPVAMFYAKDATVAVVAVGLIHIASFIQLFDGAGIIFAGGLRGIGDTTFLFRMSVILNWLIFIPLTYLLTRYFHFGESGAWISLCTLIALLGLTNGARFILLDWTQVRTQSAKMRDHARSDVQTLEA